MTLSNKLTFGRIATIPVIAGTIVLYRRGETDWLRLFAVALFCASIATDILDGAIARAWNQRTKFGTFLDPLADKLLVNVTLVFLAVHDEFGNAIPLWVPPIILGRDVLIALGARIVSQVSGQRVFNPRLPGKVSTAFQMAAILGALLEVPFAYRLTVVTVIITLISCADYLWSGSREAFARTVTR